MLEFTDLALSLRSSILAPTTFTSDIVNDVPVTDLKRLPRGSICSSISIDPRLRSLQHLECLLEGARSGPHSCPNRTDQHTLPDREQVPNTSVSGQTIQDIEDRSTVLNRLRRRRSRTRCRNQSAEKSCCGARENHRSSQLRLTNRLSRAPRLLVENENKTTGTSIQEVRNQIEVDL